MSNFKGKRQRKSNKPHILTEMEKQCAQQVANMLGPVSFRFAQEFENAAQAFAAHHDIVILKP